MKIEKRVNERGEVEIRIDGETPDYELSRKLTGTTGEKNDGIFDVHGEAGFISFRYGDFQASINLSRHLDPTYPVEKYAEILAERIKKVRNWVKSCRETAGIAEIEDLPEIAERLASKNRLYYRDSQGKIRRLEY